MPSREEQSRLEHFQQWRGPIDRSCPQAAPRSGDLGLLDPFRSCTKQVLHRIHMARICLLSRFQGCPQQQRSRARWDQIESLVSQDGWPAVPVWGACIEFECQHLTKDRRHRTDMAKWFKQSCAIEGRADHDSGVEGAIAIAAVKPPQRSVSSLFPTQLANFRVLLSDWTLVDCFSQRPLERQGINTSILVGLKSSSTGKRTGLRVNELKARVWSSLHQLLLLLNSS